jgi:hypothetical protein
MKTHLLKKQKANMLEFVIDVISLPSRMGMHVNEYFLDEKGRLD